MKNVILLILLCCSFCLAQVSPVTEKSDQEWLEPTRWETILWQPDAASALRESHSTGKAVDGVYDRELQGETGRGQGLTRRTPDEGSCPFQPGSRR